jgi:WD40 repeat protein
VALNWSNTDDRWLISAGSDKVAHIWDSRTSRPVCELAAHTDNIQAALFTSDDKLVITVSVDRRLIVWAINEDVNNVFSAVEINRVEIKNYMDVAFSQDRLVLMGQKSILVLNLKDEEHIIESISEYQSQQEEQSSNDNNN